MITLNKILRFLRFNLEGIIWITALILLAFMEPTCQHHSLCPFNALGLGFCPGCGLGHSISYFFRGDFANSFQAHPLGIFAVVMLLYRSTSIFIKYGKANFTLKTN
jgi:hypothetical protein